MKIRINEIAEALNIDNKDVIKICTILKLNIKSHISSLSIQEAKKITDYYESEYLK